MIEVCFCKDTKMQQTVKAVFTDLKNVFFYFLAITFLAALTIAAAFKPYFSIS